ncbi:MAG: ATP-binding cassette domain-containing protein [Clostridia bacterium]|nr:ATP-binding cassette domain-containing protein [Clostridia bacterium]
MQQPALKDINLSINEGEFILLLGESGSGKSTLGRVFNRIVPEFYGGKIGGEVEGLKDVGMVFQDPEKQLVMDQVEREIAFGLENIGIEYPLMRKKVMETLSFLNLWDIKNQKTYELSGGQKQKVAIGAALAMGYKFIVLDEPTSQLDPTTAEEILHVLERLNKELGYTIVLIEQRIDRCFHLADRIWFMEDGQLSFDDHPKVFAKWAKNKRINFLPSVAGFFSYRGDVDIPLTIKEGRAKLKEILNDKMIDTKTKVLDPQTMSKAVIKLEKVSFSYNNGIKALKEISMEVGHGEILGVMGQNGSGKSTLMKVICGLLEPTRGKKVVKKQVGYLSQNPNDYLFSDSVYEELKFTLEMNHIKEDSRIKNVLNELDLWHLKEKNPRDLSGGEKQRVALASVMVLEPEILLLDEPTRGLDRKLKNDLGNMIKTYQQKGKTIIVVTHDTEFVAQFCTKACLVFDGSIVQMGCRYEVFDSGIYYTTQMNKLFNGYINNILTLEDALNLVKSNEGVESP